MDKDKEQLCFDRMKRGDTDAFEYFFKTYVDALYSFAIGFLKNKGAAEDVVQEAFIYFWNNRARIDHGENVYGYLQRAVKNACLNAKQHLMVKEKYERSVRETAPGHFDWQGAEEVREIRQRLLAAIDRLPEKSRNIFIMSCLDGLKYREIARQTGLSENTVKSHVKRSYQRLRNDVNLSGKDLLIWLALIQLHAGNF